ncbi:MAG TPA: 30S ribosomal protein S20 [Candidatus Hydrogenedentes bacterium]|nr:30S ribosomal protein S20 [Candidatus Hydrogenedentota bacterium]HOK88985.1 30S ribosomal protein S20 [Candidatus Hydrogenedentota bacterium]HOV60101.1 30S ribosomal protein S20 [Candidatus Hydrogenedentota bacterium]HPO31309.1 30S ribosomal protein S20 [Candidatus Hydrogenedentota bacterium]
MANIKSQIKRIRTNEKRRLRNQSVRSRMKTMVKKAVAAQSATAGDAERQAALVAAISAIDRAVAKGVIHRNAGARKKSSLMRQVQKLAGGAVAS